MVAPVPVSASFGEVPALPVVIPFGIVVFVLLLLWRLAARRLVSLPRAAVAAALAVYAAGILANTVFPVFLDLPRSDGPWAAGIVLTPFQGYEIDDAVMNIAVFLPLGLLIPLVLVRPLWWKVLLVVAAVSLTIELAQLASQHLFGGGHVADVNDLIFNVVGGALGYGVFRLLQGLPACARLIEPFRWAGRGGAVRA